MDEGRMVGLDVITGREGEERNWIRMTGMEGERDRKRRNEKKACSKNVRTHFYHCDLVLVSRPNCMMK
jgi:hypothetical protein